MTILEELSRREQEELDMVREKHRRLREHQQSVCSHKVGKKTNHGRYTTLECVNCGACLVSLGPKHFMNAECCGADMS